MKFFVIGLLLFLTIEACQHAEHEPEVHSLKKLCLTEHRLPSMGTFFEMQLVHSCDFSPASLISDIQTQLDAMEKKLSLYQSESEISRLNRDGRLCRASSDLLTLVRVSKEYFLKTERVFDITIYPVLKEVERSFEVSAKPPKKLDRFRPLVDSNLIDIAEDCISFRRQGMGISLDGIAKGYAVDRVAEGLPKEIHAFLLNFSGNMLWRGRRPEGPWRIGFWNSVEKKVERIEVLEWGAIASSGSEVRHYDDSHRWNHLIDPRRIQPSFLYSSVTVVGDNAMLCDILSTSFSMLGFVEAQELWKTHFENYRIWFVDRKGKIQSLP